MASTMDELSAFLKLGNGKACPLRSGLIVGVQDKDDIARAIAVGKALGDLSDVRVAAATSANDLAVTYTWVSSDAAASVTGHLGVNLLP